MLNRLRRLIPKSVEDVVEEVVTTNASHVRVDHNLGQQTNSWKYISDGVFLVGANNLPSHRHLNNQNGFYVDLAYNPPGMDPFLNVIGELNPRSFSFGDLRVSISHHNGTQHTRTLTRMFQDASRVYLEGHGTPNESSMTDQVCAGMWQARSAQRWVGDFRYILAEIIREMGQNIYITVDLAMPFDVDCETLLKKLQRVAVPGLTFFIHGDIPILQSCIQTTRQNKHPNMHIPAQFRRDQLSRYQHISSLCGSV